MTKRCILDIDPLMFRKLLQLPEGTIIEDIRVSFERHGVLELRMSGCGWETPEGSVLQHCTGTLKHDGLIVWGFEPISPNFQPQSDDPRLAAARNK